MNIATLIALKACCKYESDKGVIDELISDLQDNYYGKFNSPVNEVHITYYWTYGTIHELDLPIVERAFETKNYKLWDDCRIVYPDNLPNYANLYLPNIGDTVPIIMTPFSFSLVDEFDGENG